MRTIVMSIKPEWVCKILTKEKTLEARKILPKSDGPVRVLIYCSKGYPKITLNNHGVEYFVYGADRNYCFHDDLIEKEHVLNGKIVGEFTYYGIYKTVQFNYWRGEYDCNPTGACLKKLDLELYGDRKPIHFIKIENLQVYGVPKELKEFNIKKAPQNFLYVDLN